jgi:outer membrane protein assembly factor BamB
MARQRLLLVLGTPGLLAALGWLITDAVHGQVKVEIKQGGIIRAGGVMVGQPVGTGTGGGTAAAQLSGIKIIEKSELRQVINVARDCVKDKAWEEAVTALQSLLDNREDHYVQVRDKDAVGKEMLRWTSVKFEANNLLGSMPADGLAVYEVRFGNKAKGLLDEAKRKGDRELLAEVAQRYCHTQAGIEANELLATLFLARGQNFMAALRYQKLLAIDPERAKLGDLALYKASLAFHRAGDEKRAAEAWQKLEVNLRANGGLRVGDDVVPMDKLRAVLHEDIREQQINPYDWVMVRGDLRNTAQATGSPPLLDSVLWRRPMLDDRTEERDKDGKIIKGVGENEEEAKKRIEKTIDSMRKLNMPILSGSFPIATRSMLIYRTHSGIRAVALKELTSKGRTYKQGEVVWNSLAFYGGLGTLLRNRENLPTINHWLDGTGQPQMQPNQFQPFPNPGMPGGLSYASVPGAIGLLYENSTLGTLTTDHQFIYAIDDLAVPPPYGYNPYPNQLPGTGEVHALVDHNLLQAFSLESNGKLKWQLGGDRDPVFGNSYFLGPPISVGGKLYVLNEKNPAGGGVNGAGLEAELRLVCIDPTKRTPDDTVAIVEPIQLLGMVQPHNRVRYDVSRRTSAVNLAFAEGILVCPTNAGEVFGVDLMSRSLVWSYPYRETNHVSPFQSNFNGPFAVIGPGGARQHMTANASSLANWKPAPPAIADGKVVFTAPDATSVHCINLRDGTPVWKSRQNEGDDLYLAGVYNGRVLVVGKTNIRALSLANGAQLWTLPTGDMPSGQGVASKNIYYLPLSKGEILAVDIERGTVKAHNRAAGDAAKIAPGNLVFYEGAVLSVTPTDVVAYPQLAARLEEATVALRADPDNLEKLTSHGELLLKDGQVQAAVADLEKVVVKKADGLLGQRAKDRLYEALTDLLQVKFNDNADKYLDLYRGLCKETTDDQERQMRQAKYFRIVGQGREAQGNLVEAFQMYKDFGALPIHNATGGVASLGDPTRKVPTNVWLRGRVSGMIANAKPDQRAPLEAKIAEEWKTVEAKKDIDAIRSFVGMFDVPFAVGREARLHLADTIIERNDKNAFLEAEMNLEQLLTPGLRDDPAVGGRALATLALLEQKKGTAGAVETAAGYYREIARRFAKVPVRGGKTGADLFNELPPKIFLPYLQEPRSPFADTRIAARKLNAGGFAAGQLYVLTPTGERSSFAKQHRLMFEPHNPFNNTARLVDLATGKERWTKPLGQAPTAVNQAFAALYQNNNLTQTYNPDARHRLFHIKGHLIVAQIGFTAYAFDADNGNVLWKHPLVDGLENRGNVQLQTTGADADGNPIFQLYNVQLQRFHPVIVGQIGAVEASYVAILGQHGLIAHDPLHDTVLWTRTDIDSTSKVFGDAEHIFVLRGGEGDALRAGTVLRAIDGATLEKIPDFGPVYHNQIRTEGRHILAAESGKGGLALRLYDIIAGKDVWSKRFDGSYTVLRTEDPTLTGVIDSKGNVTVLNADTGEELLTGNVVHGKIAPDDVKGLERPLLMADADRVYIALNRPADVGKFGGGLTHNNFVSGVRCQPVNGWVLALHRKAGAAKKPIKQGEFAWHSFAPLNHQMLIVEQFNELPVLLFSARYTEALNGGLNGFNWKSYTQSLSKKDGKFVYDEGPEHNGATPQYFAFNVDGRAGTINVVGQGSVVQHYIDDGRKLPQTGYKSTLPGNNPYGYGSNPYTGQIMPGVMPPVPVARPGGFGGAIIVAPPVAPPPVAPVPKK